MKKLVSIFLAILMVLAISAPVFAEENTTLTIGGEANREYVGYKLLNLTTSLKDGHHHPEHADPDAHTDECYNFAYTVNEDYRDILKKETFDNGGNYLWETTPKPADFTGITDDQILKYLANQSSDVNGVYQTMRQVADRLYRAIQKAGIAADKTGLKQGTNEIGQGYWIFADVTQLNGNEVNSLVMMDTKGQTALEINPKIDLPTVEKKVKDIDDSEDSNILDNAWHDSADHDINDTIPFKITGTLPSSVMYYDSFKMVFHDTMDETLTLDTNSVKVYMYETKHKADVDTDLNDFAYDVTNLFALKTEGLTDGCTFEISCDNVLDINKQVQIPKEKQVTKDTAFVVYYEAKLGANNGTVNTGSTGNKNEVYMEYTNNPYGNSTGKTAIDVVKVFTYKLVINKVDSEGHALEGAGFTLYKKALADADYKEVCAEKKGEDMTQFVWEGLDEGDYKLVETTVPEGYNKMSDILFSVSTAHSEIDDTPTLTTLDGGLLGMGDVATGAIKKDIVNNTGTALPETGAAGTMWLICGGAMLVMIAGVFMITRKKMSVYED